MKHKLNKTLHIECTLDSSETIMFTKGGKHSVKLENDDADYPLNLNSFDLIEISFEMDKNDKERFDFITSEAQKHREQWDKINAESKPKPKNAAAPSAP